MGWEKFYPIDMVRTTGKIVGSIHLNLRACAIRHAGGSSCTVAERRLWPRGRLLMPNGSIPKESQGDCFVGVGWTDGLVTPKA